MGFRNPGPSTGAGGAVASVNGEAGAVVLDAADVGAEPAGTAVPLTQKAAFNGVATLDGTGQVPVGQLGNAGAGGGAVSSVLGRVGPVDFALNDVMRGYSRIDHTRVFGTNAAAPIAIQTPDGSGQVVEPAIEYIPNGWNGHKWWAMITGYTGGNAATENPAIYYSDNGQTFTPVPGAPFPLVPPPANSPTGENADPELRLGPDGNLHSLYITYNSPTGVTGVWWFTSSNGSTWSTPQLLFQSSNSTEIVTGPVMLFDKANNQWVMWYTDATPSFVPYRFKRRTCAGTSPGGTWSAPTVCSMTGIPSGQMPWEGHVERRGDQIHMVITFTTGGGANTLPHFGVSDDGGLSWTFNPNPMFNVSASGWDNSSLYRGDIVPLDDGANGLYGFWYSARASSGAWRFGYTTLYVQPLGS